MRRGAFIQITSNVLNGELWEQGLPCGPLQFFYSHRDAAWSHECVYIKRISIMYRDLVTARARSFLSHQDSRRRFHSTNLSAHRRQIQKPRSRIFNDLLPLPGLGALINKCQMGQQTRVLYQRRHRAFIYLLSLLLNFERANSNLLKWEKCRRQLMSLCERGVSLTPSQKCKRSGIWLLINNCGIRLSKNSECTARIYSWALAAIHTLSKV